MADRRAIPFQRRLRRGTHGVLLLVCAALSAGGCSIKLAYNNADRLIRWSIDDYVDFERSQRSYLDGELKRLLYWHRTTQLPIYTGALRQLEADIAVAARRAQGNGAGAPAGERAAAAAVLEQQFRDFIETAMTWGEAVEAKARRTGSQMLVSLTPEQIGELPEKLKRENRKFAKEEQGNTLDENRERWAREVRKGLKRFAGRLSKEQTAYIDEQSQRYEPEFVLWIEYRERWQADVQSLLNRWATQAIEAPELVRQFRDLTDRREDYYQAFGPVSEANQALALETFAGVFTRMTAPQAERFHDRMLAIIEDLDELVAEAKPEPPPALTADGCLFPLPDCPGSPINNQAQ